METKLIFPFSLTLFVSPMEYPFHYIIRFSNEYARASDKSTKINVIYAEKYSNTLKCVFCLRKNRALSSF